MLLSKNLRLVVHFINHQKLNEDEQTTFSDRSGAYRSLPKR